MYRGIAKELLDLPGAQSRDGKLIPTNYVEKSRFRAECDLCLALHYMFHCWVPQRVYSKGYEFRTAINYFLDYVEHYESGIPKELHLSKINHLSPEIFIGFDIYLKKVKAPKDAANRFKGALDKVSKERDEGFPVIALPRVKQAKVNPYEPINEECFKELTDAFEQHVQRVHLKLEYRREVDSLVPYSLCEALDELGDRDMFQEWKIDHKRALKTLLDAGYPHLVDREVLHEKERFCRLASEEEVIQRALDTDSAVPLIIRKYDGEADIKGKAYNNCLELYLTYLPSASDQAGIVLFLMLQTGWNKETVMALQDEDFLHPLSGAFSEKNVLIVSEKNKGQATGKPYKYPKQFLAPSSIDDGYSAYNLIKLSIELSKPFKGAPFVCTSDADSDFTPVFLVFRDSYRINGFRKNYPALRCWTWTSLGHKQLWVNGCKRFFEIYSVSENGVRIKIAADISARLRPTWVKYYRDNQNSPLSVIALQQGHVSAHTTDIHYDSSGPALYERRKRLGSELESIMELLRARKFKGLIANGESADLDLAGLRIFTLPGYTKSLWACSNPYAPDWDGAPMSVAEGQQCNALNKCLLCSRVCIFEDSLPFLMARQNDLEQISTNYDDDLYSIVEDELEVIEYVLSVWGDAEAMKKAARYYRREDIKLPNDFNELAILFEG